MHAAGSRLAGFLRPPPPAHGMAVEQPKRADSYNPQNPAHNPNTGGPTGPARVEVTFVVQGDDVRVDVDPSRPTREDVELALKKAGVKGDAGEWKARTVDGRALDGGKSLVEEGIGGNAKIYLNRGPGRGG